VSLAFKFKSASKLTNASLFRPTGSVLKVKGDVGAGIQAMEHGLQMTSTISTERKNTENEELTGKMLMDTTFHKSILIQFWSELSQLRTQGGNSGNDYPTVIPLIQNTVGDSQLRLGRFKPAGTLFHIITRNEEAMMEYQISNSGLKSALAYFNLSIAFPARYQCLCFQAAICNLMQGMTELKKTQAPTAYAYFKVISFYCEVITQALNLRGDAPRSIISSYRFTLAALYRSSQLLSPFLPKYPTSNDAEGIFPMHQMFQLCRTYATIWRLGKLYPFLTTPFLKSLRDETMKQLSHENFQTGFLKAKLELEFHSTTEFPKEIYEYAVLEGLWKNWLDEDDIGMNLDQGRIRTMQSLLHTRSWDLTDVENTMCWSLIRRTPAGWLDNEQRDLDFSEYPSDKGKFGLIMVLLFASAIRLLHWRSYGYELLNDEIRPARKNCTFGLRRFKICLIGQIRPRRGV